MSLKEQMAVDAKAVFLNGGEFAEEITYTPAGGSPKLIKAAVVRRELSPAEENMGRSLKNQAEIYILTDSVEGTAFVNRKDDRITLFDMEGNQKDARINEVMGKDEGLWHLLVGW